MNDDAMYACAECGSPSVEFSPLVGGDASCKACEWSGRREELVAIPVQRGGLQSAEQTFLAMYNDFRSIFRTNAGLFTRFLVKWGFVDSVTRGRRLEIVEPKKVIRYVNAMFQGALLAVFDTRKKYEKERVSD